MLGAPAVHEAGGEEFGHLAALFVGEAGVEMVGVGILEVDLLVGHVHVATHHHALLGSEAAKIPAEGVFPTHSVVEATKAVLRIRGIDVYQVEIRHLERHDAPLVVVFFHPNPVIDRQRLVPCINHRSGVALFVGIVPVGGVAGEFKVDLAGLELRFLKADEIGVELHEDVGEALASHCAKAVHVPADKFHRAIRVSIRHRPWCLLR